MRRELSVLEWYEKIGIDIKQSISVEKEPEPFDSETK